MGKRTGNPRGRPPGSKSARTVEREKAMAEAAKAVEGTLPEAFTGDAHTLLMTVYKDLTKPIDLRVDAAKAAIRYEKPALSAVEAQVDLTGELAVKSMTDEQLGARKAALLNDLAGK